MKWFAILGLVVQSTIWVIVILVLTIWLYISLSEYCCSCFRSRMRRPASWGAAAGSSRGLQPPQIDKYPTFSYPIGEGNASVKVRGGITECAVCLGPFSEGETLRLIPVCGHVFHADCVDVWLRSHTTCPCCRANLLHPPPETIDQSPV